MKKKIGFRIILPWFLAGINILALYRVLPMTETGKHTGEHTGDPIEMERRDEDEDGMSYALQLEVVHGMLKETEEWDAKSTVKPVISMLSFTKGKNDAIVELTELSAQVRSKRVIYFITPTYERVTQMVDLVRLKQTLESASLKRHKLIYWIVIEDSESCTKRVRNLLEDSGLHYAHHAVKTPKDSHHKGVVQRNRALEIVEEVGHEGIVYFGDDDNAYDIQLFTELTFTKMVSIFSVGFAAKAYDRCEVSKDTGEVIKIHSRYFKDRKFPIDMAGFAFSTGVLHKKHPRFQDNWEKYHLETRFLELLADSKKELEPLAGNCTKILAWHVRTSAPEKILDVKSDKGNFDLITQVL